MRYPNLLHILLISYFIENISGATWNVEIKTGTRDFAGTSARVTMEVYGTTGNAYNQYLGDDFQNGETKYKTLYINVGRVKQIKIGHDDSGFNPGWDLNYIKMRDSSGLVYTFTCRCWVEDRDRKTISSAECYYDQPIDNCATTPVRVECHVGRCTRCHDGYFIQGYGCKSCGQIQDCSNTLCNSLSDRWCTKCRDADLFKLETDGRSCERTCSWEDRWCWPGTCGSGQHNYARDCVCDSTSFTRVFDSSQAVCKLTQSPEAQTCRMSVIDSNNDVAMSVVPDGQPNKCSNQPDFYGNIQVERVITNTTFDFVIDVSHLESVRPDFVSSHAFGITDVVFLLLRKQLSGSEEILRTITLKQDLSSSNPEHLLDFDEDVTVSNGNLVNGQRLCLRYSVRGGGHLISKNVQNHAEELEPYSKTSMFRDLCYRYDDATPVHCKQNNQCIEEPIQPSSRILTSRRFTVTYNGWEDPSPVTGDTSFASGIHTYVVNMYELKESGTDYLEVDRKPVIDAIHQTSPVYITIPEHLPNPAMYAIVLDVKDVANNVRHARRFVMFDNSSAVQARKDKRLYSTTASVQTGYKWQVHLGNLCYSWIDRYYNDKFYHLNLLKPIKPDYHSLITGVYEQNSGILPVSGTENIHGITMFHFSLNRDDEPVYLESDVPNFTTQQLCLSPTLNDGETYRFDIVAEDVMTRTYTESLYTHIDSSKPEIFNIWLEKDGYKLLFVHNSTDLSKMVLNFESLDIHSGLHSVDWSLGTSFGAHDIGRGSLGVSRLQDNSSCPEGVSTCYCPAVGPCAYFNFTLKLNSLVHANTHNGNHNRDYHFTLTVTNVAQLSQTEHLEILSDDSPPAVGVVMEGPLGGPDIDYTNEDSVHVHWDGFIDHESGIKLYKIGLAKVCVDADIFSPFNMNKTYNETLLLESTSTSIYLPIKEDGRYFVTVVAYNNAMEPSVPVCSDGITLDRTPPVIANLTLQGASISESIICSNGKPWLVTKNLTRYAVSNHECTKHCLNTGVNALISVLPYEISNHTGNIPIECNISKHHGTIYVPIDLVFLQWNLIETESQVHDVYIGIGSTNDSVFLPDLIDYHKSPHKYFYKQRHVALSNGDEFYIFLKIINSANLLMTAAFGPILIDETPPLCPPILPLRVHSTNVFIHWNTNTFVDTEQQEKISSFTYRIGRQEKIVSGFKPLFEHGSNDCVEDGQMCFIIRIQDIHLYDVDEKFTFFIEVNAFNKAEYHCSVYTEVFRLMSQFPPGQGVIYEVPPQDIDLYAKTHDTDIFLGGTSVCLIWKGFENYGNVTYEFGLGKKQSSDDIISFYEIYKDDMYCINTTNLNMYHRYFSIIRANSSGGSRVASSDGFIIVNETDIARSIRVFDGRGCPRKYMSNFSEAKTLSEPVVEYTPVGVHFHVGHTYTLVSNVSLSIEAKNAVISSPLQLYSMYYYTFVPMTTGPQFTISFLNGYRDTVAINTMDCIVDVDAMFGFKSVSVYWTKSNFRRYIHKFQVELRRISDVSTESSPIAITSVSGNITEYTFSNLDIEMGRYFVSVKPCVEQRCLNNVISDGFIVVNEESLDFNVQSYLDKTRNNCSDIRLLINNITCPTGLHTNKHGDTFLRWGIFKDGSANVQVSDWNINRNVSGDEFTTSHCISTPVYPHTPLFTCVEVYCPVGSSGTRCSPLVVAEDPNLYDKSRLYEVDSDADDVREHKGHIYASNIGDKMSWLHGAEVDFTSKPVRIGGIILGIEDRPVTWYLLKDFKPDTLLNFSCYESTLCEASINTFGGFGAFQGISLESEVLYYLCAYVDIHTKQDGRNLQRFQTCGNGFFIDVNAPSTGEVNIVSSNDYIIDTTSLLLHWSNFQDFHGYVVLGYMDSISEYRYAIGREPYEQDVIPWTSAGSSHSIKLHNLRLDLGLTYFVSLKAMDHVGHSTTVVSKGVLFDNTPPITGIIQVGTYLLSQTIVTSELSVHLIDFHDDESGMDSYHVGIGSASHYPDIIPFRELSETFAYLTDLSTLEEGHKYYVTVMATNRAGLSSIASSEAFTVDRSPPTFGVVRDGLPQDEHFLNLWQTDVDFQTNTTHGGCHWSGFADPHSGIKYYLAGLGSRPLEDDIRPMSSTASNTRVSWQYGFVPGIKYFCRVQACNGAGLCTSASSNGFITDVSPPLPGIIHVGIAGHHSRYWAHPYMIQAQWLGFIDVESGIASYSVCIGRVKSKMCDILPFTNFHLANSMTHAVSLPEKDVICVKVRAFNHLGMYTDSVSDSFIVDATPPILVTFPVLEVEESYTAANSVNQYDPSLIKLTWKFHDTTSPIVKHIVSVKTHHEGHSPIESLHLTNINNVRIALGNDTWLKQGDTYTAIVTACNEAGLCATGESNSLLIDSTPPHLGGFQEPLLWRSVTESNGTKTFLNLTVYGFTDVESDIKAYYVTAGKSYSGSELSGGVLIYTPKNYNTTETLEVEINEGLIEGEKLIMSVWVENSAGLISDIGKVTVTVIASNNLHTFGILEILKHSCDAEYCNKDCTCAVVGGKCHTVQADTACKETNRTENLDVEVFIRPGALERQLSASSSCLSAYWTVNTTNSTDIKRFEWSMGQQNMPVGTGIFDSAVENIWYDVGKTSSVIHCLKGKKHLQHGTDYVAYVKAWTSTSDFTLFTSAAIHIDNTPPTVRRGRFITENSNNTCTYDQDFTTVTDTLTACWTGVFTDPQSGIHTYYVSLGSIPGGDDIVMVREKGLNTSVSLVDLSLSPGTKYYVTVTAINYVGLHTTIISDGLLVDKERPYSGVVYNTNRYYNLHTQNSPHVGVSFQGFADRHSSVESFFVAIEITDNNLFTQNVTLAFNNIGLQNSFIFYDTNIKTGQLYRFAVKAIDAASFESDLVFSPYVLFDSTAPKHFNILQTSDLYNGNLTSSNGTLKWKYNIGEYENLTVIVLQLYFQHVSSNHSVQVSFEDHIGQYDFRLTNGTLSSVQLTFFTSPFFAGDRCISIMMEDIPYDVELYIDLSVSDNISLTGQTDDVVSVQQISLSELKVDLNVLDQESGIKYVHVGAGSSLGGFQIYPLTLVPSPYNIILHATAPHGNLIHVTVIVENHAGNRIHFHSKPIKMDHTPPIIHKAEIMTFFSSSVEEILTKVHVSWEVKEEESLSVECSCTIDENSSPGVHYHSDSRENLKEYETPYLHLAHGTIVYAHVTCINSAGLRNELTVGPETITILPPNLNDTKIVFNTDYETISGLPVIRPGSPFAFSWVNINEINQIRNFSYRIIKGDDTISDWETTDMRNYISIASDVMGSNQLYTVEVKACNQEGIYNSAIQRPVLVHGDAPLLTDVLPKMTKIQGAFIISWNGVFSTESDLFPKYTLSIGSQEGLVDLVRLVETSDQHHVFESRYNGQDVYCVIVCSYVTDTSAVFRGKLTIT